MAVSYKLFLNTRTHTHTLFLNVQYSPLPSTRNINPNPYLCSHFSFLSLYDGKLYSHGVRTFPVYATSNGTETSRRVFRVFHISRRKRRAIVQYDAVNGI